MPEIDVSRFPKSKLPFFAQAVVIRALRGSGEQRKIGGELACLRRAVLAGQYDEHPAAEGYAQTRQRMRRKRVEDMPPNPDDVWVLIETLSQRHGAIGHAKAWKLIGVTPGRGRDLLARSSGMVDWPLWSTLLRAALD